MIDYLAFLSLGVFMVLNVSLFMFGLAGLFKSFMRMF